MLFRGIQVSLYTSASVSGEHSENCVHLRRDRDLTLSHDEGVHSFFECSADPLAEVSKVTWLTGFTRQLSWQHA